VNEMKPRFEPRDEEFDTLLSKAKEVEDRIAKRSSQPEYTDKQGSTQGYQSFMTQSAGKDNVRSAGYSTNNHLIESEDVANKGAISEKVDVFGAYNTHYPTNESTLGSHEIGSDEQPAALTKMLGTNGDQLTLDTIAKSVERLSRHI
tara:strand:+ start:257 stop:697 length:441 start_codon:yes stop_codon:yes gene_type:complete